MRVIFLTHYYPPEIGAPQARIQALAEGLAARGHTVTVHTGFPNYPGGRIPPPYRNRPASPGTEGEVRVLRSLVLPAANRGFALRIANHTVFAAGAVAMARLSGPTDVVVVETPPLFLAGAGIPYSRLKRARLVLHVSDLWPQSAIELGALRGRAAIAAARAVERRSYRAADAIVAPTRGIESTLLAHPEVGSKAHRIPPSVDTELFSPGDRPPGAGRGFRLLYAGTLGMAQGIGTLVDAAELLRGEREIEFLIAGDGAEAAGVRERLETRGPANVSMSGAAPHERVPELYAEADAAVVLLRDRPLFHGALPTKILEAMSAGRPVVLSAAGEAARLVEEAGCGVVVPPERPAELAEAIRGLARDPERARALGEAGRRIAVERYSRVAAVHDWEELLEGLAPR